MITSKEAIKEMQLWDDIGNIPCRLEHYHATRRYEKRLVCIWQDSQNGLSIRFSIARLGFIKSYSKAIVNTFNL